MKRYSCLILFTVFSVFISKSFAVPVAGTAKSNTAIFRQNEPAQQVYTIENEWSNSVNATQINYKKPLKSVNFYSTIIPLEQSYLFSNKTLLLCELLVPSFNIRVILFPKHSFI